MIDEKKAKLIQDILYAAAFLSYLIAAIVLALVLFDQFSMIKGEEGAEFIINYLRVFGMACIFVYAGSTAALLAGFLLSVTNKLTLKKNAIILSVFFVIGIVVNVMQLFMGGRLSAFLIEIALPVAVIIAIVMNFGTGKIKNLTGMYIVCGGYTVYTLIIFIQKIAAHNNNVFSNAYNIVFLSRLIVSFLILFQIYCAENKGKEISE